MIEVKIIKHLREIYCGDEFLVADAEHYKRLRVLKEEAVRDFLTRAKADWAIIHKLIDQAQLIEMEYGGKKFYMRRLGICR